MSTSSTLAHAVSVPWSAFVAVFLYYVALTLVVIGGADLPVAFMAATYLLPVASYAVLLGLRAVRALAALPVEIGETPHALIG